MLVLSINSWKTSVNPSFQNIKNQIQIKKSRISHYYDTIKIFINGFGGDVFRLVTLL